MSVQRWKFEFKRLGGHTHVAIRCGPRDHSRPKLGDLIMDHDQWDTLHQALRSSLGGEFVDMSKEPS